MPQARYRRRTLLRSLLAGAAALAGAPARAQEEPEEQAPATAVPLGPALPPEATSDPANWPMATGNYAGTRAAAGSAITAANAHRLGVAWRAPITASTGYGGMTAPVIAVDGMVYAQDMRSGIWAYHQSSGVVEWTQEYDVPTLGPNGLAAGYGLIYGVLGDTAEVVAVRAATGEQVWRVRLSNNPGEGVAVAPTVHDSVVYVATVPGNSSGYYRGGTRGIFFALDAATGATLWQFDTTTGNLWGNPRLNSGGGVWYSPTIDARGNIYFGTGNAAPWPGTKEHPNGSSRPGPNDYANSLVSLDAANGALRWAYNAKPHDLFDLDFQLSPVLVDARVKEATIPLAIGAGKNGRVVALHRDTGAVVWTTAVGKHQNDDLQAIPEGETVEVYPGPFGGVETPMACAGSLLFVPVVNGSATYTSSGMASFDLRVATGELVALDVADGSVRWRVEFASPTFGGTVVANDVVFVPTLDGLVRGFAIADGRRVFAYQAPGGNNAPLTIRGDTLFVPAAGPFVPSAESDRTITPANVLVALRLGASGATPAATPSG